MKQFKKGAPPAKTSKAQSQPTPNPPSKQEIDAALQKLTQLIQKDPEKAAKIFEAWLDTKGQEKKNVQKKRAA